ncbi:MAG: hypothetical protein JWR01_870, partial [Subtercola sp.]|nr:hypothetical protein [Subtercola sp.]
MGPFCGGDGVGWLVRLPVRRTHNVTGRVGSEVREAL